MAAVLRILRDAMLRGSVACFVGTDLEELLYLGKSSEDSLC